MSWQRSKHVAKTSLKWLNWTLVLPIVVLTVCLMFLLYTAPGLKLSLSLAEALVPGLSVGQSDGSLLGGHQLFDIQYSQPDVELRLQRSEMVFNNRCFLSAEACIEKLVMHQLQLTISATAEQDSTNSSEAASLWLPFPLTVNRLSIDDSKLNILGQQLQWQHFNTQLQIWGNKIQLSQPHLHQLRLTLADNAPNAASQAGKFQYQAPELTDFTLPLSVFISQFQLTDGQLRQNDTGYQFDSMAFTLQWQRQRLALTDFELEHNQATLQAALTVDTISDYPLDARLQLTLHRGELANQQLQLRADGTLADLQLTAQSQGPVQASLSAQLNLLNNQLPHQVTFTSSQLQWPLPSAEPEITLNRGELTLRGDLNQSNIAGRFSLAGAQLPAAAAEFSGRANLNSLTLDKLIIDTLDGQINASVTADWQQQLSWQSDMRWRNIQPELFWPNYAGNLSGKLSHNGQLSQNRSWQLNITELSAQGILRDYTFDANGNMQLADLTGKGDIRLSTEQLRIQHADNAITLKGSVQQSWQLDLQLSIPDLAHSVPGASGAAQGDFTITGPRRQPRLQGELRAQALDWQQWQLSELAMTTTLWLDSKEQLNAQLELLASDAYYQQQQLQQARLTLTGSEQQHQLSAELLSADHQLRLNIDGALLNKRSIWQGHLQHASISSLFGRWELQQPVPVNFTVPEQRLQIAKHCWQQNDSSLCLTAPLNVSNEQATMAVQLNQFNLALLTTLLPSQMAVTGIADATLSASWQRGSLPRAEATLRSDGGTFTQQLATPLQLEWQQLEFDSALIDDTLQSTLLLHFAGPATLNAKVQVNQLQRGDKQLTGNIQLQQLQLPVFQPLLGEQTALQGQLSADVRLEGSLDAPQLHGDMVLQHLSIKGKKAPVDINNADARLSFNGQQASISGNINTPQGEISLTGDASWQQMTDWQAALHIQGDELRLLVPQARLQLAPDLMLKASPELTQLEGSVTISQADINIDSLPEDAVELSDDLVLLDEHLQPIPQRDKTVFNLKTDINVVLGNQVKLSAFGLTTRLNGSLRVRQHPRKPLRINGDVSLQDGTFRAYGQDLLIRKGKMSFNGPSDQPFLNIEAIRNPENMEDDVIAGIRVTGPADEPNVVIFSEPAKAQANALSYLLLGRDLDSSSASGGNAVTTGLIGMTLASSSKVVGELGEAFGLEDLTLDTAGAGDDSQVTVSGYLSRDLQLKYGYGIFNAVGEFTVRYRLMRRLYLEAVSGVDNAVDLLYKFEFD